jgi:hypothetical protein
VQQVTEIFSHYFSEVLPLAQVEKSNRAGFAAGL